MKRTTFIKRLTAGFVAIPVLPKILEGIRYEKQEAVLPDVQTGKHLLEVDLNGISFGCSNDFEIDVIEYIPSYNLTIKDHNNAYTERMRGLKKYRIRAIGFSFDGTHLTNDDISKIHSTPIKLGISIFTKDKERYFQSDAYLEAITKSLVDDTFKISFMCTGTLIFSTSVIDETIPFNYIA